MHADLDLGRESPFRNLSVHCGAGKACAGQDSLQADDFVSIGHGLASIRWQLLVAPDARIDCPSAWRKAVSEQTGPHRNPG